MVVRRNLFIDKRKTTSHDDRFDNGAVKRTLGLPQNVLRTSRNPYAAGTWFVLVEL